LSKGRGRDAIRSLFELTLPLATGRAA
jgi:hypothetical protein